MPLTLSDELLLSTNLSEPEVRLTAPDSVFDEMESLARRDLRFTSTDLIRSTVDFVPVFDRARVALLSLHLGRGEAEAIALAAEMKADLLLLDERLATRTARRLGLRTLGPLGVLLLAERRGFFTQIEPVLVRLEEEAGLWISDR